SASHNPSEYNGLKLFSSEGRVIPSDVGARVERRYRASSALAAPAIQSGRVIPSQDSIGPHWNLIRQTVDVELLRRRRFKVLVDANRGSGSLLARRLLDELGCTATILGEVPDGKFEHRPEPTAENLAGVLDQVRQHGCDVGFCQDPDADRLAVIDEHGRYLGEEYTLAMCVQHVLGQRPGAIVTNCSTSRMTEDLARKFGVPFFRSAVGEANVVDAMLAQGAVLGGEGNGGVIDPRVGLVRDSFVGMAMILAAMAARQASVSQLADELPRYEIVKTKIELPGDQIPRALERVARHFADASLDRLDGLRFDWPGKWLLVRASNTEPIVRAIAEAATSAEADRLCQEAQSAMLPC
ncbi:MAG TPA: phosphoglucosamine mutase, partial [Pirellulales bacterium]|nr:phosphoglucosamine mutase [Pirellulales bacterium]